MKPHHQPSRLEKAKRYPSSSSILYQSPTQEIFILDIPRSLELAQQLSTPAPEEASQQLVQNKHDHDRKSIVSCRPLREPYPRPPEPKSAKARKRVLDRIPVAEREFDELVVKVIEGALGHVRARYTGEWCLARECLEGDDEPEVVKVKGKRKRAKEKEKAEDSEDENNLSDSKVTSIPSALTNPPIILSPGINSFPDTRSLRGSIVKNPSPLPTTIHLSSHKSSIYIPPKSTFLLTHLSQSLPRTRPTIDLPKFTLLLFDPPWPNRSVRRSAHYTATPTFPAIQSLVTDLIYSHLQHLPADGTSASAPASGVVGIWTTNSAHSRATVRNAFGATGLEVFEEWIWVKCTDDGVPVIPLGGIWRRAYEVLMWGRKKAEGDEREGQVNRRVILAVPDVHSRKPALKELVESVFFSENGERREYTAMEVFARNLTAGWWSVGDEVWKFNCEEWWRNK